MIISKNNIRYIRLKEEDIELVRKWRNHPSIKNNMVYREYITPEMQKKWFASINNNNNLYFIIEYKGKKIGLINGKDINWEDMSMETGIFIWHKYYRKSHIPTICSMIFADVGVTIWKLHPRATILKSNEKALRYNKSLGFKVIEDDPEKEYVLLSLEKDSLGLIAKKLRAAINLMIGDADIRIEFEKEDLESGLHDIVFAHGDMGRVKQKETKGDSIIYYF